MIKDEYFEKNCFNCVNAIHHWKEDIIWCDRYNCLTDEVLKEEKNPSCFETLTEKYARRFATCRKCKNLGIAYPNEPIRANVCMKGNPIPRGNPLKKCPSFEQKNK